MAEPHQSIFPVTRHIQSQLRAYESDNLKWQDTLGSKGQYASRGTICSEHRIRGQLPVFSFQQADLGVLSEFRPSQGPF